MTDRHDSPDEEQQLAPVLPAPSDTEGAPGGTGAGRPRHARAGSRGSAAKRPRRRVSVVGVFGEVLVTAGVLVLLFIGWQTWWQSGVLAGQQTNAAADQSNQFLQQATRTPAPTPTKTNSDGTPDYGPIPVAKAPGFAQSFAVIYVPRFGADWKRTIRESVDVEAVLNSYDAGVGHYPGSQMPGGVGNFAIAAHDTGYGNAFIDVSKLQIGDDIYIQTKDGYYTYQFRNMEYIQPNVVQVLFPVPQEKGAKADDRYLTMTTCNPPYHAQERIAAFGVLQSWQPLSAGPPKAIASAVGGN